MTNKTYDDLGATATVDATDLVATYAPPSGPMKKIVATDFFGAAPWAIRALTPAADKGLYFTSASAAALMDFTSVGRTLVGQSTQALMRTAGLGMSDNGSSLVSAADYSAMRTLLSLVPGTDVQPFSAALTSIAGLTTAPDKMIYTTASNVYATTNLVSQARSFLAAPTSVYVTQTQTGTGAVTRTVQDKFTEVVSVTDYGVSTTASAADNLANFKLAVAATPVGGVLDVPPHADPYIIDTTGGLSACVVVNKRITIRLRGDVKANFSAIQANPPYIFNFTGANSGIEGPGRVFGDGTVNALSDGSATAEQSPGLIRLAADYTFCRRVTFVNVPKIGLLLYGANYCDVRENRVTGGITAYSQTSAASQTAYFGIYAAASSFNEFFDNWFYPDASGGMVIQCIFSNGSSNSNVIARNFAYRPYEKLVYWFGNYNYVHDNYVVGNTGTIPGTNVQGTIGAVLRMYGEYNVVSKNYTKYCGAGAAIWDGVGNQVVDNQFLDCGSAGIAVLGSTTGLSKTRVDRNTATQAAQIGQVVADGIEVTCSYSTTSLQVSVCDNVVSGFSITDPIVNVPAWQATTAYNKISTVKPSVDNGYIYDPLSTTTGGTTAGVEPTWPTTPGGTVVDGTVTWVARAYSTGRSAIRVTGNASGNITHSTIVDNNNYDALYAVTAEYVTDSTLSNNDLYATTAAMTETNGARNRWFYNAARGGGTATVVGIAGTSTFIGGTITGTGAVVLATSPTLVTPVLGVAAATSIATGLGLAATPAHTFTGDLDTGMWSPAANTLALSTAGAEAVRIDSSGKVSIGTTSAAGALYLYQTAGGTNTLTLGTNFAGGNDYALNPFITSTSNGGFELRDVTNSASRIVVQNTTGYVGINTTAPDSYLTVSANTVAGATPTAGTVCHLMGANTANARSLIDSYGGIGMYDFRRANGTTATPTALLADDYIGSITWSGYGATGYSSGSRAQIRGYASEGWTDTAQGTYLTFLTTPNGTASGVEALRIGNGGVLGVGIATTPTSLAGAAICLANAGTVPTANPASGGVLYSEGGALKWRSAGGTTTTIAPN